MRYARVVRLVSGNDSPTGKPLHAGQFVEFKNRQTYRRLLAEGAIEIPDWLDEDAARKAVGELFAKNCGVLIRGSEGQYAKECFGKFHKALKFKFGSPSLPYEYTLIWDRRFPIMPIQVLLGFNRVEKGRKEYHAWEMACMLQSARALIQQAGSAEDKKLTKKIIGDLRVPAYSSGAIWFRKTETTKEFVDVWLAKMKSGISEPHAFLQALYLTRPMLCTLPAGWRGG